MSLQTALETAVDQNFQQRGEVGCSVVIHDQHQILAEVHRGHRDRDQQQSWQADTLIPVYSASKGISCAALLHQLNQNQISTSTAIGDFWGEFPLPQATIEQALSHQCGLAALDQKADVLDHTAVIEAIEAQAPAWQPGQLGYHPRTWGFIADEISLRLTQAPISQHITTTFGSNSDFHLGLAPNQESRVGELLTGKPSPDSQADPLYQALAKPDSLPRQAFASPRGLHSVADMNTQHAHAAALPAMSGIASARALAHHYAQLANNDQFSQIRQQANQASIQAHDQILCRTMRFSHGFQQDPLDEQGHKTRHVFGPNLQSFGHPGAGGSHSFADPEQGIGFAYVMNQMDLTVLPSEKALSLVRATYQALLA